MTLCVCVSLQFTLIRKHQLCLTYVRGKKIKCIRVRRVQSEQSRRVCEIGQTLLFLRVSKGQAERGRGSDRNMNTWQCEALGGSEDPTERTERLHQSLLSVWTSHHRCSTSSFTSRHPPCPPTVRFTTSQVCVSVHSGSACCLYATSVKHNAWHLQAHLLCLCYVSSAKCSH